ncbi:MAG: hypothetical protein HQK53_12695 [Oligoflexia bacterium]|nr:hypothetical protein [Oligoflexia bacterium]
MKKNVGNLLLLPILSMFLAVNFSQSSIAATRSLTIENYSNYDMWCAFAVWDEVREIYSTYEWYRVNNSEIKKFDKPVRYFFCKAVLPDHFAWSGQGTSDGRSFCVTHGIPYRPVIYNSDGREDCRLLKNSEMVKFSHVPDCTDYTVTLE